MAGYPYVKEAYLKTFDSAAGESLCFLLPKIWKAKRGKVIFKPLRRSNIYTTSAFFYHSRYPLIGGALKGWLPLFPWWAWRLKISQKIRLVFSPSEPLLFSTLYQGIWSKLLGLKHLIFTWENTDWNKKFKGGKGKVQKMIFRLNLWLADGVVCGNQKAAANLIKWTAKPLATIPLSGVDSDFFQPVSGANFRAHYHLTDKLIFSFAGALDRRKGLNVLLAAFAQISQEWPQAHLIIAGHGDQEAELKHQTAEKNWGGKITFLPWLNRPALKNLLAATDVFVYPSLPESGWEEQFGYSLAEASLMERPVISTRSGSIEEVVIDGETGLLVKPGEITLLREAMRKLARSPDLRKELGRKGRKFISENYGYQVIAKKFFDFFGLI